MCDTEPLAGFQIERIKPNSSALSWPAAHVRVEKSRLLKEERVPPRAV